MHASQSIYMNSSKLLLHPEQRRVQDNIATILQKIDTFNGSDRDALRPLCAKVFPKQKYAGDYVPLDLFVELFNERFLTRFTHDDVAEVMEEFRMDPSRGVHPFKFFLAIKATGLPLHTHWTHDREQEINENVEYVKKNHPVSFERMKSEAEIFPLTLNSERALKEIVENRLEMYTTKDIDKFRQVFKRLDIKNTDRDQGLSKEAFKSHIFSKFGFTLSHEDVEDIARKYPLPGGRVDFRKLINSILAGSDNLQLPITQVDENYERRCQRIEREKFYDREYNRHTIFTVKDVRKILNQKIGEFSSRDTDQYRQFFRRLSSRTHITKEDLFEKLWTIFHLSISDKLKDKVFHTIDLNGDGYMELSEFVAFLKNETRVSKENIFGSTRNLDSSGTIQDSSSQLRDTWSAGTLLRSGNGRRRTSVTTPYTFTDRGVSIDNLLKGIYNPAMGNGRATLQSSCGYRLVSTPPPQSNISSRMPSRMGMRGASRMSSRSELRGPELRTPVPPGAPSNGQAFAPGRPMTQGPRRTNSGRLLPDVHRSNSFSSQASEDRVFQDIAKDNHYSKYASPVPVAVSPLKGTGRSIMGSRMSRRTSSAQSHHLRPPMKLSKAKLGKKLQEGRNGSKNNLVPCPPRHPNRPSTGYGANKPSTGSARFFRRNPQIAKTLGNATSYKAMTPSRLVSTEKMTPIGPAC